MPCTWTKQLLRCSIRSVVMVFEGVLTLTWDRRVFSMRSATDGAWGKSSKMVKKENEQVGLIREILKLSKRLWKRWLSCRAVNKREKDRERERERGGGGGEGEEGRRMYPLGVEGVDLIPQHKSKGSLLGGGEVMHLSESVDKNRFFIRQKKSRQATMTIFDRIARQKGTRHANIRKEVENLQFLAILFQERDTVVANRNGGARLVLCLGSLK